MFTNVTIGSNAATSYGGGSYQNNGSATVTKTAISGNTTPGFGGGVYASGAFVFMDGGIYGNTATDGGGVFQLSGNSTFSNTTMSGNQASQQDGGAMTMNFGSSTFTNVVITGNTAHSEGGAMDVESGTLTLTNVMVSGNSTPGIGGALDLDSGTGTFTNVTISGNTADSGGGLYIEGFTALLRNTIVARNIGSAGPDVNDAFAGLSGANSLIGDGTGQTSLVNGVNGNLVGTTANPMDPRFAGMTGPDWTQWNLRLRADTPAVNAGNNAWIPARISTDLAGVPRLQGGTVDMGAYEYNATAPTVVSVMVNDGSPKRSMVNSLTVAFSEPVTLTANALSVMSRNGSAIAGVTLTALNLSGDQITWVLTFSGLAVQNGSLQDGAYRLVVNAAGVSDLGGNSMIANYTARFYRLFGDSDGDRVVSRSDLIAMRNLLNQSATVAWWLDYDGNGKIDANDLRQLRARLRRALS